MACLELLIISSYPFFQMLVWCINQCRFPLGDGAGIVEGEIRFSTDGV
jgi:hypothetical protein